jgi:multimeric flavodoxin WrbA
MNITMLNGSMTGEPDKLNKYLDRLEQDLMSDGCTVDHFRLIDMNLHFCTGCWSCWWKTPGQCATKDDAGEIFRSVIHADFLIFASPLIVGFPSSRLKMIMDRLIVLLHPYILLKNGEYHHHKRYDHYPDFGLVLEKEADTDQEDIHIVRDIFERFSLNFHNNMQYLALTDQDTVEDVARMTPATMMETV